MELDTEEGFATYWLREPIPLSFKDMLIAADDAAYTITSIQIVVEGITSQTDCESCGHEVTQLTVKETGQSFELTGTHPSGQVLRKKAKASDWESEHPRLTILE